MINKDKCWLLHNASEYTINGETYRNLEAQVLYNKKLSEQNYKKLVELTQTVAEHYAELQEIGAKTDENAAQIEALEASIANIEAEIQELTGDVIVHVSGRQDDLTRPGSADKTWAEIWQAINEDKEVICVFNYGYFRYMALGEEVTFPLIFGNNGAYTDTGRMDTIQVDNTNTWQRVTIAVKPTTTRTIQTGDKLLVGYTETNGDMIAEGALSFNTANTGYFLCQDGTFKALSGQSALFRIEATHNMSTGNWTFNKTYMEIYMAFAMQGQLPYVINPGTGDVYMLSSYFPTAPGIYFEFSRIYVTSTGATAETFHLSQLNTVTYYQRSV